MGIWDKLFGKPPAAPPRPTGPRAGELRDGQREGVWVDQLVDKLARYTYLAERTYRAGVLHGAARAWLLTGSLHETSTYVDGKQDGVVVRYHPSGAIASETWFARGTLHGPARSYDASGVLTAESEYRDGTLWTGDQKYGAEGRGRLENGKKVGLWEKLAWDNRIGERGEYVDGVRHGRFELRDSDAESWHGEFAMGERVGIWELRRDRSAVCARGTYPEGTRVSWTATLGDRQLVFEIATPLELLRWIRVVEAAFVGTTKVDFTAWPADEQARARAWLRANVTPPVRIAKRLAPPVRPRPELPDEPDPGAWRPVEARIRDILVAATGDIATLAYPPDTSAGTAPALAPDSWSPPTRGTLVVVGTIDLPGRMLVASPDHPEAGRELGFRPGTYELVGLDTGDRLSLPLVIIRLVGAAVVRWRYLGDADDCDYGVFAPDLDIDGQDWPEHPGDEVRGPAEWIRPDVGPAVFVTNPTGNGIRAYGGVGDDGDLVAVLLQLA